MKKNILTWIGTGFGFLGTFSSLSSGPMIGAISMVYINFLYFFRFLIKYIIYILLGVLVLVEIASNRHAFYLVDYISYLQVLLGTEGNFSKLPCNRFLNIGYLA